jgi:hypothetical protein
MAISRRFFLKSGAVTAVVAGIALSAGRLALGQAQTHGTSLGYQIPISAQQEPTYMFTRATFDPYVGSIFQAPNARGNMINLKLLSATTNKPSASTRISTARARDTDSFSLMFKASAPLPPFTSIHKISHPSLGKFDLFLTPHPQEGGAMFYEAVFNHI